MKRSKPSTPETNDDDKNQESNTRVLKQLKNFVKNHAPNTIAKRHEYAKDDSVQKRRKDLNYVRRKGASTSMNILRNIKLYDVKGNEYYIIHNRVIREKDGQKEILYCDKRGVVTGYPFKDEIELLSLNLDSIFPKTNNQKELHEALKKLLDGDKNIEELIKKKKSIVHTEMDDQECYWKNMDAEEKEKLLNLLKP